MMKIIPFLLYGLVAFNNYLIGQNPSFAQKQLLFEHPSASFFGENFPFLPFDYNEDGVTDFIGATYNENQQYLYMGLGDETFEDVFFEIGSQRPLMTIDFDSDGDLDIIFENSIQFNKGDDTFESLTPLQLEDLIIIGADDFNNDGNIDLVSFNSKFTNNKSLHIHYNLGNNEFDDDVLWSGGETVGDFEFADMDGDGNIDIGFLLQNGEIYPGSILFNRLTYFEEVTLPEEMFHSHYCLKFADIDNDNDTDLMAVGLYGNFLIVENKNTFFSDVQILEVESEYLNYFDLADLDNDGDLDLVGQRTDAVNDRLNIIVQMNLENMNFGEPILLDNFDITNWLNGPENQVYALNSLQLYDYDGDDLIDVIYTDGHGTPRGIYLIKNETKVLGSSNKNSTIKPNLNIHPNPASDILELNLIHDFQPFEIFSNLGQKVLEGVARQQSISIDLLDNGIYFLKIEGYEISRFIKH